MSTSHPLAGSELHARPDPAHASTSPAPPAPAFAAYAEGTSAAEDTDAPVAGDADAPVAGPSTESAPGISELELEQFREQDLVLPIANIQRISALAFRLSIG